MFRVLPVWAGLILVVCLALAQGTSTTCSVKSIDAKLNQVFSADGSSVEAYPFKIGDYNRDVQKNYPGEKGIGMSLPYPNDVIAFVLIYDWRKASRPGVLRQQFATVKQIYGGLCFNQSSMLLIGANTMHTTAGGLTLPVVHVQTAGHTAGGAFYYQRHHVTNEPDEWAGMTIYGISAHTEFGVNTRFAAVIVFKELSDPTFVAPTPPDIALTDVEKIKLLNKYNTFG